MGEGGNSDMVDIWESAGHWYVANGDREYQFDTEQEARRGMALLEQNTGEQEIIEQAQKLIPVLRDAFRDLLALQNLWQVEDINTIIAEHMATGEDIANWPLDYWVAIGTITTELLMFMERPIDSIQQTPNQVLTRRNWRK